MPELSRRDFVRSSVAAAAVGAAGSYLTSEAADAATGHPFIPYNKRSYFRRPVNFTQVNHVRTRRFHEFMRTWSTQVGHHHPTIKGLDGNHWGVAFAIGHASDPIWRLTGNLRPEHKRLSTTGFHAPAWFGRVLTQTSDSPFTVMDRANGITVSGAKANVVAPRTIRVGAAGLMYHSSNGLDKKDPHSNDHRNKTPRGRIADAMVIRADLVEHGIAHGTGLGHVLHMFFCQTRSASGFCHPMVAAESGKNGWGAEGQRIAIHPGIDLSKRGLSKGGLVIARTLQRHGCYLGDNAGRESCLKAEQSSSAHDVWSGQIHQHSLSGITWADFVVIRRGH